MSGSSKLIDLWCLCLVIQKGIIFVSNKATRVKCLHDSFGNFETIFAAVLKLIMKVQS